MIPIRCMSCGEAARIDEAWLGQMVECPHCGEPTPATPPPPLPPAAVPPPGPVVAPRVVAAEKPSEQVAPTPVPSTPKRPLTRAERLAIRRRRHLILALGGGLLLLIVTVLLMTLND